MWSYLGESGEDRANEYRPRVGIKHIDSKRALKGFTARNDPDKTDLIPEGSPDGKPEKGYKFRGHFLDLRTLAFALTDRGYSLETACEAFGVEHGKQHVARHGAVTEEYIDYNRRDVLATAELAVKLLEEYDKHPITLQATKAYSPASIGKAYLREMGIKPVLERQPTSPRNISDTPSRRLSVGERAPIFERPGPGCLYRFPFDVSHGQLPHGSVAFVTASEIRVVEHCGAETQAFLRRLTADDLFKPETWKHLTGFVESFRMATSCRLARSTVSKAMIGRSA